MGNFNLESENKALDALMAAAFRLSISDETTNNEDAGKLAANPPKLSPEDEVAIESLGANFVEKILKKEKALRPIEEAGLKQEIKEAYAAMNRGNSDDSLSDQTRREIERKRKELLGEDYKRKEKPNGS